MPGFDRTLTRRNEIRNRRAYIIVCGRLAESVDSKGNCNYINLHTQAISIVLFVTVNFLIHLTKKSRGATLQDIVIETQC